MVVQFNLDCSFNCLVKPENVQLTINSSNEHICQGEVVNFTCSAVGDPVVHTYQLFVNDILVNTSSSSVVWSRTLTTEECSSTNVWQTTLLERQMPQELSLSMVKSDDVSDDWLNSLISINLNCSNL